jgi:hypothetical protein
MPKNDLKTLLYLFQLMNMEKLQEVPHSKKTIFKHLVLEKTTKQLIQTVISKKLENTLNGIQISD